MPKYSTVRNVSCGTLQFLKSTVIHASTSSHLLTHYILHFWRSKKMKLRQPSTPIFSSYIRKCRMDRMQSHILLTASSPHIWLNIWAFPHILGSLCNHITYVTLKPIPSEFPSKWGKFLFLFYQCCFLIDTFLQDSGTPPLQYIKQ